MSLPPGTLLQLMYLKERIDLLNPGIFLEIGCSVGHISQVLLKKGWQGVGIDLNQNALEVNEKINIQFIKEDKYQIKHGNFFLDSTFKENQYDLVISSMVLEHLDDIMEQEYFERNKNLLRKNGKMILLVPSSPQHWGIEDEIAGHFRRYTRESLSDLANKNNFKMEHSAGLTFPLSNLLLPLSNYLVRKQESDKLMLTSINKTIDSGYRAVKGKTNFPKIFSLFLNKNCMYPLHILQKIFKNNANALILYAELTKIEHTKDY